MLNQWALDNHICNKYLPTLPDLLFNQNTERKLFVYPAKARYIREVLLYHENVYLASWLIDSLKKARKDQLTLFDALRTVPH